MKNLIYILLLTGNFCFTQENCTNGIDDDGDGFVDLNDGDCECIPPVDLLGNGDFEDYTYLPNAKHQVDRATGWLFPMSRSGRISPKASYYNLESMNGLLQPYPSGQGAVLMENQYLLAPVEEPPNPPDYNLMRREMIGRNLADPFLADQTYIIQMYVSWENQNINRAWPLFYMSLWGKNQRMLSYELPYGFCPNNYENWSNLAKIPYQPELNSWTKIAMEFTPTNDVHSVVIGLDCDIPTMYYQLNRDKGFAVDKIEIFKKNEEFDLLRQGAFCLDNLQLTAQHSLGFVPTSYQWYYNGVAIAGANQVNYTIDESTREGYYSVRAMNDATCRNSSSYGFYIPNYEVEYQLQVDDLNKKMNIVLANSADYTYSIDGENFQSSTQFSELLPDDYTLYIKNGDGCIIKEIGFAIFELYNVFTPNGDGFNDTWLIKGLQNYPGASVQIFDKMGVEKYNYVIPENLNRFEWNGNQLPSGTYWYLIEISPTRKIKGVLTIKRK